MTRQAFDSLAPDYDTVFTDSPIARYLRAQTHQRLIARFQPGASVLELGCGTGEDALFLARRGVRVLATDASDAMLAIARQKTAHEPLVQIAQVNLKHLRMDSEAFPSPRASRSGGRDASEVERSETPLDGAGSEDAFTCFDGVFASFGPLNVLDDCRPLAAWLAPRVKPGGIAAFGVMSPVCLWEIGWHSLHGNFRTAFRRFRRHTTFQPDPSSEPIPIHYPSIRRLTRDFSPGFRRVYVRPLGLFLPPSDVYGAVEKRPRLLNALLSLERRLGAVAPLALVADHYWIEFERLSAPDR